MLGSPNGRRGVYDGDGSEGAGTNPKTPEEAAIYGGEAGKPYDSCYHQACDTYNKHNDTILDR